MKKYRTGMFHRDFSIVKSVLTARALRLGQAIFLTLSDIAVSEKGWHAGSLFSIFAERRLFTSDGGVRDEAMGVTFFLNDRR